MKLLDLFAGAGGAAMGYSRAGFTEIVGVDLAPQSRYPFTFVQADAMTFPLDGFDVIHASPPCQHYSWSAAKHRNKGKTYPDLLQATRERLRGRRFVIENVSGAAKHMPLSFVLCGSMFNLGVQRHRLFESSELIWLPFHPECTLRDADAVSVTGHGPPGRWYRRCTVAGHGGDGPEFSLASWKAAMGIDWMTRDELTQAIPPAYTEYIGKQLIEALK